jgi:uncharacterized protein (TIGR02217 family)
MWPVKRTPLWKTTVKATPSGREWRTTAMAYPRYRYALQYEFLRSNAAWLEFQTLLGFFNARNGGYDTFLFTDQDDSSVTAQVFGTGDGVTTQFQLVRTLGGVVVPVYDLNGAASIYKAAVLQGSGYSISATGLVTFTVAPANGLALTWTGSYYWRVRFDGDELELSQFLRTFWSTGQVKLITVKP